MNRKRHVTKKKRADGQKTRNRLLIAAGEVFAEKGYHEAKVAGICKRAESNVAAVNYYFGTKADLYVETWRHTYMTSALGDPPDRPDDLPSSAEKQLGEYIQQLIQDFSDQGKIGQLNRLYLMELVNPTGLIDDMLHKLAEPRRLRLREMVAAVAGIAVNPQDVIFCEMSIMNQCRIFLTVSHRSLEFVVGQPITQGLIEQIADHITRFSIAGIKAIKKEAVS